MVFCTYMELTILIAFLAGLVSFLSPCVLPLVPGYLAFLGSSTSSKTPSRYSTFVASIFFVLGFTVVFAILGVLLNTLLSGVAYEVQQWLGYIGGIIIIGFGLFLTGLLRIPYLEQSHTIRLKRFDSRILTSFVFGAAFAVGWTPCVGAALGATLTLAATQPGSALVLLLSYGIGLGVPFLVVGALASRAEAWIKRSSRILGVFNVVFGALLIILGVLVFTQSLSLVANFELLNSLLL